MTESIEAIAIGEQQAPHHGISDQGREHGDKEDNPQYPPAAAVTLQPDGHPQGHGDIERDVHGHEVQRVVDGAVEGRVLGEQE